jgi:hypothetical protein
MGVSLNTVFEGVKCCFKNPTRVSQKEGRVLWSSLTQVEVMKLLRKLRVKDILFYRLQLLETGQVTITAEHELEVTLLQLAPRRKLTEKQKDKLLSKLIQIFEFTDSVKKT